MSPLQDEIDAFEKLKPGLEAEHRDEWVLVRDRNLIGLFPSFEAAAAEGLRLFGRSPYLVRQIGQEPLRLPVSVIYHRYGA